MPRTEQIFSKVRRNIHKISERDIKDKLVYQTMQKAQEQIIMLTQCLEKEITVTTVADQGSYVLLSNGTSVPQSLVKKGTTAERTAFGATLRTTDVCVWVDTDLNSPYFWNGTEWV